MADNAGVCFQMKAGEIRGQINPTEERSSEAFNLSYWSLSNRVCINYQRSNKWAHGDAMGSHVHI